MNNQLKRKADLQDAIIKKYPKLNYESLYCRSIEQLEEMLNEKSTRNYG